MARKWLRLSALPPPKRPRSEKDSRSHQIAAAWVASTTEPAATVVADNAVDEAVEKSVGGESYDVVQVAADVTFANNQSTAATSAAASIV